MHGAIPGYPAPGTPSNRTVPGTYYGYPSILPVIATRTGLARGAAGAATERLDDLGAAERRHRRDTPYSIDVNLATEHLSVYEDGIEVLDFPAGIGAPDDPTPPGQFFIFATVPPPDPSYGPFVLATSDHSDTIVDWENSGDALIGIHGPITSYDDSLIGTTGAAISHGCIRLHDADLAQLAVIPPGTPLNVVS